MFGPRKGLRQRTVQNRRVPDLWALIAAAAVISCPAFIDVAHAQDRWRGEPDYVSDFADDDMPAPEAAVTITDTTDDDDVSRLFADAEDDLDAGRFTEAQRKFERVIALDPDGHLAKDSRSHLGDLYRTPGRSPGLTPPPPPASPRKAAEAHAAPATPPQPPPLAAPPEFDSGRSSLGAASVAPKALPPPLPQPSLALPAAPSVEPLPVGPAVAANVEEDFISTSGDRVFFAAGSAELGQRARVVLASQARWLSAHGELVAVIEGHADDGAMPKDGLVQLSQARAAAVRDRLVQEGIPAARLTLTGLGRQFPVSDCPSPDCSAQNRRVVTTLKIRGSATAKPRPAAVAAENATAPTQ